MSRRSGLRPRFWTRSNHEDKHVFPSKPDARHSSSKSNNVQKVGRRLRVSGLNRLQSVQGCRPV